MDGDNLVQKIPARYLVDLRSRLQNMSPTYEPVGWPIYPKSTRTELYEDREANAALLQNMLPIVEAHYKTPLKPVFCYGIRKYSYGQVLCLHRDQRTHIYSASLCVAAQLNKPWPLIVGDRPVVFGPGEMAFFKGVDVKHGRPVPLDGNYYATIFIHYGPK